MARRKSPAANLNSDGGDDVQRRFRYQATVAASLSLMLLNDQSDFVELFCEHHEDILMSRKDGTFDAVQVKTRAGARQNLFKADDGEILAAISRFAKLDKEYPGEFCRFVLVTNERFWQGEDNSRNLPFVLECARSADGKDRTKIRALALYVKRVVKENGLDSSEVINTLAKTWTEEFSKLRDVEMRLVLDLAEAREDLRTKSHADLRYAAESLINCMLNAGSQCANSLTSAYFALCKDPASSHEMAIIQAKRITSQQVEEVISKCMNYEYLLPSRNRTLVPKAGSSNRLTEKKMVLGGISEQSINLAKDHKSHAEYLLLAWQQKYGTDEARTRYDHLWNIAITECTEAFDEVYGLSEPFGRSMLMKVRGRLRSRLDRERDRMFGCSIEHLMGVVSILTEDCKVWWSDPVKLS
jgi:hypothetical protein